MVLNTFELCVLVLEELKEDHVTEALLQKRNGRDDAREGKS